MRVLPLILGMKKTISLLVTIVLLVVYSNGQPSITLGTLTKEEIELKECSFDKTANAVVLLDEAFSDYGSRYELITYRHIKIKILKSKGIEQWSDVSIPFYRKDDFESIDKVEGLVINQNSSGYLETSPLDKRSIFTKNVNERFGLVKFAFPAVKEGSVIDYTYRSTMKNYGGLEDWEFQKEIPVIKSKYKLSIIPGAEFAYRVNKKSDYDIAISPDNKNGSITFEMNNIAGLRDEPYMDARTNYVQKVTFQLAVYTGNGYRQKYMTSWAEEQKS